MCRKLLLLSLVISAALSTGAFSQNQLDPNPLDPSKDPDIDMFMGNWQESIPFNTHGSLTERAVLTKLEPGDDPLKPHKKGAVLIDINRFSRAHLDAYASTTPVTLKGEQEVLYFTSGKGSIKAGKQTAEVRDGIFVLIPEGLEFTITNTDKELLILYLVNEPVPDGFVPKKEMIVRDEKNMPFRDDGFLKTHWSHNGKNIFNRERDGLATLSAITLITFNAMTIGQPHSHGFDLEEIWTVIEGTNVAFLGKEIRWQHPGTAYKIPQTNFTPHSNINVTEKPIKFLYIAVRPQ
jgi:mannose-6-phosphate isomerase-like protein (cupin superfamily)